MTGIGQQRCHGSVVRMMLIAFTLSVDFASALRVGSISSFGHRRLSCVSTVSASVYPCASISPYTTNGRICRCNFHQTRSAHVTLRSEKRSVDSSSGIDNSGAASDIDAVKGPLALLLLSQFVLFVGVGAIVPAIPLYGQSIGLSQASNGIVISAPAVALLLGAKWGGNYADMARKPAMMIGMAAIAVFDIGTALSTTLPALIAARLGLGAGRCLAESGERGMLADLAGRVPALRGRALAAQQAVIALGIAIGAPLGGIVIETYGPRASFLCVSAGALIALFLYIFLPETVVPTSSDSDTKEQSTQPSSANPAGEWTTLLSDDRWKGLAICQSGASFGFAAKVACIPILSTAILPGGAVGTGALLSLAGLSGLVGAPFGGWLTDRIGARFTATLSGLVSATGLVLIPVILSPAIMDLSSIDVSVPFLGGDLDSQATAFVAAVLLWSTGAAAQGPALTAVAQEMAPLGAEATALALPRASGDGTYIVAPLLLGIIADSSSSVGAGWECAVAGTAGLIGATALASTGRNSRRET